MTGFLLQKHLEKAKHSAFFSKDIQQGVARPRTHVDFVYFHDSFSDTHVSTILNKNKENANEFVNSLQKCLSFPNICLEQSVLCTYE